MNNYRQQPSPNMPNTFDSQEKTAAYPNPQNYTPYGNQANVNYTQMPAGGGKAPKKNRGWIAVVIALLLIIGAGSATVWMLLQEDSENDKNGDSTVLSSENESSENDTSLEDSGTSLEDSGFSAEDSNTSVDYSDDEISSEEEETSEEAPVISAGLIGISIETYPNKMTYTMGDPLDTEGLSLLAQYEDGTTQIITEGFTCWPKGFNYVGEKKVTVTYGDKTTSYDVTVEEADILSISIIDLPRDTVYNVGETFKGEGLKIIVHYVNGISEEKTDGFVCHVPDFYTPGVKTIVVSYGDKTTSFTVTVESVTVSSVSVLSTPHDTSYYVGESLNTAGLMLRVNYSDGTSEDIASGFTCSPTYFSSAGTKTITVSYGDKSTSFTVTVQGVSVTSISVKTKPNDTSYYVGESLNTAGLKIRVNYSDGTSEDITSGFTCSPTHFSSTGTKTITVSYSGKSTSFTVTVGSVAVSSISINSTPNRTQYRVGDSLDTAGLRIKVNYADGSTEYITSGFTCSPTYFSSIGTKAITVSYGGKTTSFYVTVTNG